MGGSGTGPDGTEPMTWGPIAVVGTLAAAMLGFAGWMIYDIYTMLVWMGRV